MWNNIYSFLTMLLWSIYSLPELVTYYWAKHSKKLSVAEQSMLTLINSDKGVSIDLKHDFYIDGDAVRHLNEMCFKGLIYVELIGSKIVYRKR